MKVSCSSNAKLLPICGPAMTLRLTRINVGSGLASYLMLPDKIAKPYIKMIKINPTK